MVKRSKINTQQRKALENQNILDIKPVIIKHPKTLDNLSKAIRQTRMVSRVSGPGKNSNGPWYSKTKNSEKMDHWFSHRLLLIYWYFKVGIGIGHPKKSLINIQNIDDKEFLCCLVNYLNPAGQNTGKFFSYENKVNYRISKNALKKIMVIY